MIKAVLLDIDNTLLDFNESSKLSMKSAFKEFSLKYDDTVPAVFKEINDVLWRKIETGELTREKLYQVRWNMIFDKLGIDGDGPAFDECYRGFLTENACPVNGALDLLEYLSPKYTLCAASNAAYKQQTKRLEQAGLLKFFDFLFVSERIGYPKPSKEFFDACFSELKDISKDHAIMIGDSLTADIGGGVSYGIKTCWYNHNHEPVPPGLKADYTVDSLYDIMKIL